MVHFARRRRKVMRVIQVHRIIAFPNQAVRRNVLDTQECWKDLRNPGALRTLF